MSKDIPCLTIDGRSGSGATPSVSHSTYPSGGSHGGGHNSYHEESKGGSYGGGSESVYNTSFLSTYQGYGNSQGLGILYEPEEVLGMSGHTAKNPSGDSETIYQIIEFSRRKSADCWGSNALNHGSGGKDAPQYIKAINLGGTDMHDRDSGNLFYVLRDFNFNLEILNLSNNRIGDLGVESMIYGITSLQYQTLYSAESGWKPYQSPLKTVQNVISINLSNNQISDKGAELLAHYLANGSLPSTKSIDVSGNQITSTGEKDLIRGISSLETQDIAITLKQIANTGNEAMKATLDFAVKGLKYVFDEHAKSQGLADAGTLAVYGGDHCKKGLAEAAQGITLGFVQKATEFPLVIKMLEKMPGYAKAAGTVGIFVWAVKDNWTDIANVDMMHCLGGINRKIGIGEHQIEEYAQKLVGESHDCEIF